MRRFEARAWVSPSALLLVGLYLGLQVTSLAHVLLVPHQTCVEHGASVHAKQGASHASAPLAGRTFQTPEPDAHESHEHCGIDADARQEAVQGREALALGPAPEAPAAGTFVHQRFGHARLFQLAPKSSPPA